MFKKAILISISSAIAVSTLSAQTLVPKPDATGRPGDVARFAQQIAVEKFDTADKDKDGKLSMEELELNAPYLAQKLKERDKDGDGFLNWEEYVGHNRWPR